MDEEMERELALEAAEILEDFIGQRKIIAQAHDVSTHFFSVDQIFAYLGGVVEKGDDFHRLYLEIGELWDRELFERLALDSFSQLKIVQDAEHRKAHVAQDLRHHDWTAVLHDAEEIEDWEQVQVLSLKHYDELLHIVDRILRILKPHVKHIDLSKTRQDLPQKEQAVLYYFFQIYKYFRALENVLQHLRRKESIIERELRGFAA